MRAKIERKELETVETLYLPCLSKRSHIKKNSWGFSSYKRNYSKCAVLIPSIHCSTKNVEAGKETNHIDTLKFPDILYLFYTETSISLLIRKFVSPKKGLKEHSP